MATRIEERKTSASKKRYIGRTLERIAAWSTTAVYEPRRSPMRWEIRPTACMTRLVESSRADSIASRDELERWSRKKPNDPPSSSAGFERGDHCRGSNFS